jgi:hypothetical protein
MSTLTDSTHPSRTTRRLLACGLIAPLFLVVVLIQDALRPGYQPLHHFVSELSLGRGGRIQTANFVLTGALLLGFAVGLRRALRTDRGSRSAPVLAGVSGAALVMAGMFQMDPPPGYPPGSTVPERPTLHGSIHGYTPIAFFVALTALALVLSWRFAATPRRCPWTWLCLASATLALACFMTMASCYDFATQTGHYHGLFNRLGLAVALGWLAAVAQRLRLDLPEEPAPGGGARHLHISGTPARTQAQ